MPQKIIDGRTHAPTNRKSFALREKWNEFLRSLAVGDSFVVANYSVQYVDRRARELDYDIVKGRAEQYRTRIWIHGIPGDRRPIIERQHRVKERVISPEERDGREGSGQPEAKQVT